MKTIKASQFVPGRIYSVVYENDVEMVQKRELATTAGLLPCALHRMADGSPSNLICNPLADCTVTVRRVMSLQAAGDETYANAQRKQNPAWQPSEDTKAWWKVSAENDCICEHRKTGVAHLRAISRSVSKEEYFIGGKLATDKEAATIKAFKKSKSSDGLPYIMPKLENLSNVRDNVGE